MQQRHTLAMTFPVTTGPRAGTRHTIRFNDADPDVTPERVEQAAMYIFQMQPFTGSLGNIGMPLSAVLITQKTEVL
jgi:hypothetical protein